MSRLVSNEALTPAQLEQAAQVARLGSQGDARLAMQMAEMTLQRSSRLLGLPLTMGGGAVGSGYDPAFINVDVEVGRLTEALSRRARGSFLFSGPPGTGKSELARHLAEVMGLPVVSKRASDLLSKWVGDNERHIAEMFQEAGEREAVLVLDEADSFLTDRRQAERSWEVTLVNEMLTQMEAYPGVFIATTNLDTRLDQASIRRFMLKVRFDWMTPDQAWALFQRELTAMGQTTSGIAPWEKEIRTLTNLAPGDFAVVLRQAELWGTVMEPGAFCAALRKESQAKEGGRRRIGFV